MCTHNMCVYIFHDKVTCAHKHICIHTYTYIYMPMNVCVYIYTYIHGRGSLGFGIFSSSFNGKPSATSAPAESQPELRLEDTGGACLGPSQVSK